MKKRAEFYQNASALNLAVVGLWILSEESQGKHPSRDWTSCPVLRLIFWRSEVFCSIFSVIIYRRFHNPWLVIGKNYSNCCLHALVFVFVFVLGRTSYQHFLVQLSNIAADFDGGLCPYFVHMCYIYDHVNCTSCSAILYFTRFFCVSTLI